MASIGAEMFGMACSPCRKDNIRLKDTASGIGKKTLEWLAQWRQLMSRAHDLLLIAGRPGVKAAQHDTPDPRVVPAAARALPLGSSGGQQGLQEASRTA